MTSGAAAARDRSPARASATYLPSRRSPCGCATAMPRSSANVLTGDATTFMPRPAGRSGWVRTSGTSKPAATIRASATRANSGVPAKATRIALRATNSPSDARLVARLLQHPRLDARALERAQVFDEDLAEQVIHLVLHGDREQPLGVELARRAAAVERAHANARMARDLVVDLGDGEAAFLRDRHLFADRDQLGIDQHDRLVARLGDV